MLCHLPPSDDISVIFELKTTIQNPRQSHHGQWASTRCSEACICLLPPSGQFFPSRGERCCFHKPAQGSEADIDWRKLLLKPCFSTPLKRGVNLLSHIQVVLRCPKSKHSEDGVFTTLPWPVYQDLRPALRFCATTLPGATAEASGQCWSSVPSPWLEIGQDCEC